MNVLFATDGSDSARTAGRLLTALLGKHDSHVTVLSAAPEHGWVPLPKDAEVSLYPWLIDLSTQQESTARRAVEIAAADLREHGVAATVSIRRQSPAAAVLEQAEADDTDLIVVGSHGSGVVERFLVGSVSERVARYARCSVLVARTDTLRHVLVAVDDSEASEHALDLLVRLSLPPAIKVTMVHVVSPRDIHSVLALVPALNTEPVIEEYDRECRALGEQTVRHAQERLRAAGCAADTDLRIGTPVEQIVAAAWGKEADLVVLGAENRWTLGRRFLGCVSGCILNYAPCSVLVAR